MIQYLDLLEKVLTQGIRTEDRTGVGTRSLFGHQMKFNLQAGFPLLTTKKVHWKSVVHELLWMLSGDTNTRYLEENGVTIWNEWANSRGELGPVYGHQWRTWETYHMGPVDQISQVLDTLKTNPTSRRMVVSAWNVADLPDMALAPCHCLFQFHTSPLSTLARLGLAVESNLIPFLPEGANNDREVDKFLDQYNVPSRKLNCQLYQRSADVFLGVPFNVGSYSLLTMMVAQCVNMVPGEFIWTGGDVHLYDSHIQQAQLQLTRTPTTLPQVVLNPQIKDLFAFTFEDITLEGYVAQPSIKAPVAI